MTNMATEENTDRFYFERCVLPDESDCEFDYTYVPEDDGTRSVELNSNERLEEAIKNVEQVAEVTREETTKPTINKPSIFCKPELPEDFVRNFLVMRGMQETLDTFQDEWYKLQESGLVRNEDDLTVDDVYSLNLALEQDLAWLNNELEYYKKLLEKSKERYAKVTKERDHHKIHHRRLYQEKERMSAELIRMKEHLGKYEPVVDEISTKYKAAMKEKMLTRMELEKTRNQLECYMVPKHCQPQVLLPDKQRGPAENYDSSYAENKDEVPCITNISVDDVNNCNTNDDNSNVNNDNSNVSNDNSNVSNDNLNTNNCAMFPCEPIIGPCGKVNLPMRIRRDPRDSTFPKDQGYNPYLATIKLPARYLSVYGGFKPLKLTRLHALSITSVKVDQCKTNMATTSDDYTWKLWDFKERKMVATGEGHLDWVADCDFSPCGKRLATASGDTTVKIWDTDNASCLHTFMDHQKAVWSCSWHYNGDFVATSSLDKSAKIWDLNSFRCRFSLRGHKDSVNSIEFLHYSNILITGSADKNVCLWDARMGICGDVFKGHHHSVNHCSFNMKGNMVVSCDSSGCVMTWDLRARKRLNTIFCGPAAANMVSFDPTGTLIVVASNDSLVKIIELGNEKVTHKMSHQGPVQCINYDPEGRYFISGASDRDLVIWS